MAKEIGDMTFEAEALCKNPTRENRELLIKYLRHHRALVREGAIYGSVGFLPDKEIEGILQNIALTDRSKAVREAAAEALEGDDYVPKSQN